MPKAIQPDFRSIFEAAPGLYLILLPDLTIIAVSNAYLQATMTKRTDIIGHHLFEIFPDNPADSSATGVSNLRFSLNYALEHKTSHTMAVQKYDIRKPDGTFEERYWSPINKPVLNSGNEVEYIIHRVEDITEFILLKKHQQEKEGKVAVLELQIEEMEIETYKRAQEIQQINQQLLSEIELRKKAEENLIAINTVLDFKVFEKTSEILKSKNSLTETFERITDAFVALDKNWCYTYVNAKAEQIFNRPPGYLIGKHIWTEFPEGIDHSFYKAYFRAMEEQQYIHVEEYYPPYDLWFENHIYPSPEGLSIFFRDITEKKKAEEALRQNHAFTESIINASPDIIYIYDIEERKNTYANEGLQKNLGYSAVEIKEMGDQVIPALMHPEDFEYYLQTTFPKYADLKDKEIVTSEFRMKDRTGGWHWLDAKESIFLRNSDGTPKQIFGIIRDITERKKVQNEIIKEKNLSNSIIDSLPGVFYLYNKNGKFLRWNRNFETVTKYSADEIKKMHPLDFYDDDEKKLLSQKISNVFESGEDNVQANFLLKTKEKIPYYFTGMTIDYEGTPCLMGVGIDFSERAKAYDKIKETSLQLRKLTAHLQTIREEERKRIGREIHDELGQQLTAIKMDVAWIDKKTTDEQTTVKNKLKNIITLLDGSNASVRKILNELRPGILENHSLLDALEWLGHQFTESTGIPVEFKVSQTILKLDEEITTCIFRVYQESLTNIMRYSKAGRVLTSLNVGNNSIVFIVEDNGIGFNPAFARKKKSFGILGMKERALSLNGEFELVSTPGKGTKICLKLPYTSETGN